MKRTATVETLKDIQDHIGDGVTDPGVIEITSKDGVSVLNVPPYIISLKANKETSPMYYWAINAVEDKMDKDSGVSNTPLKDITEFMSEGAPGDEFWNKMASKTAKLKRIAFSVFIAAGESESTKALLEAHMAGMRELFKKMLEKGWDAKLLGMENTSYGLPNITFEIGEGSYEGTIELESILYDYKFEVDGYPDVTEEGHTDSVINSLRIWSDRSDVSAAYQDA